MAEVVKLELSDTLARRAREIAISAHRRFEDLLIEWIEYSMDDLPVESLPDEQVLALCDMHLEPEQQKTLDELLAQNREGRLSRSEAQQLEDLMQIYRKGLVRKAKAWKVAVDRKLKAPLSA